MDPRTKKVLAAISLLILFLRVAKAAKAKQVSPLDALVDDPEIEERVRNIATDFLSDNPQTKGTGGEKP